MALRGLHSFIFAFESRIPRYTCTKRVTPCRHRRYHGLLASNTFPAHASRGQISSVTCAPHLKRREGRGLHSIDISRSDTYLLSRGRERERNRWRGFYSSAPHLHQAIVRPAPGTGITIHFQDSKAQHLKTIEANEGDNILDLAHEYDIDLEGACEGSVACSTCHVILGPSYYDLLPEPEDDENDMLDMAFGLTDTSRLGCQVKITRDLDGMVVTLPSATRNMFVDGVKPTKH